MDYDQYLEECKKIKERNYLLLDLFKDDLIQSGLKDKTISRHLSNVEFYINEFLTQWDYFQTYFRKRKMKKKQAEWKIL